MATYRVTLDLSESIFQCPRVLSWFDELIDLATDQVGGAA